MTVLEETLTRLRQEDRPALVAYFPAGFPDVATSIEVCTAMVEAGVDAVEIGLPYSDPVMDGPTIQDAATRALAEGVHTADVFDVVRAVAATGAPTVVMSYWNPVERYGVDAFAAALARAGGSGLVTPDLTPDEAGAWTDAAHTHGLDQVFLVAPSSTDERLAMTAAASSGFVYATSVMGVTGSRARTSAAAPELVRRLRAVTDLPVGVGLGVSTAEQAVEVGGYADAVIVGSALVRRALEADRPDAAIAGVRALARELRAGVDGARRSASA